MITIRLTWYNLQQTNLLLSTIGFIIVLRITDDTCCFSVFICNYQLIWHYTNEIFINHKVILNIGRFFIECHNTSRANYIIVNLCHFFCLVGSSFQTSFCLIIRELSITIKVIIKLNLTLCSGQTCNRELKGWFLWIDDTFRYICIIIGIIRFRCSNQIDHRSCRCIIIEKML